MGAENAQLETWLTFHRDWRVEQSGPLVAGQPVRVQYALERLHTKSGGADDPSIAKKWNVTGYYSLEGGEAQSFAVAGQSISGGMPINPVLTFDRPGELQVWFELNDTYGLQEYDSNFGKNFHFVVYPKLDVSGVLMGQYLAGIEAARG